MSLRGWTDDEWENLEQLSAKLARLLAEPDRDNRSYPPHGRNVAHGSELPHGVAI